MQNSYVKDLTSVYLGIIRDAMYAFPTLVSDLVKDQVRLLTLIRTRGLPFLMVDLANLGRHLDRCLSTGKYIPSGLPASRSVSSRVGCPVLFRGLYLLVFDASGDLKENADVDAIFFLRQLLGCGKKAKIMCSDAAISEAIEGFVAVDNLLPEIHPWWDGDQGLTDEVSYFPGFARDDLYVTRADQAQVNHNSLANLDAVFGWLVGQLEGYDPLEWRFSHGHGSVSNLRAGANRYKFLSWPDILETAFPLADVAFHSYASWADAPLSDIGDLSSPSRLMAVTKTLTKPRLIASEPVENMFCQQNIRRYMYARVRNSLLGLFVKFDDQSQNQRMCLSASVDGSLATLDLSEASDRVTCQCVGNVFRYNLPLLRALRATRTQSCEIPGHGVVRVRKYSTMGNATTFPVQSLVFLGIALAGCLGSDRVVPYAELVKRISELQGKVSVFGDDIIVPKERVGSVYQLLECLHFKVNVHKSYSEGNFRESCGVDAFRGINITPVYWRMLFDGSPESYESLLETTNNFYRKFLVVTSEEVRASMRRGGIRFPDVPMDSGVSGFESFVVPDTKAKRRWNKGLQTTELLLPCISASTGVEKITDDSAMLQFFTELPDPYTKWVSGIRSREVPRIRHRWVSERQVLRKERGSLLEDVVARYWLVPRRKSGDARPERYDLSRDGDLSAERSWAPIGGPAERLARCLVQLANIRRFRGKASSFPGVYLPSTP